MKSATLNFSLVHHKDFKTKMLNWANRFNIFCLLDNNGYNKESAAFDFVLAAGARRSIKLTTGNAFEQMRLFYEEEPGWLFGHLGYDLKNEIENLETSKHDLVGFGPGFFFEPEYIIRITGHQLQIIACSEAESERVYTEILTIPVERKLLQVTKSLKIESLLTKPNYLEIIEKLRQHIKRGDCYEINFCQQFFVENIAIDAIQLYAALVDNSPNPFGALYKLHDKYCCCASPERYLKKYAETIISQPIKGTSRRSLENDDQDERNKKSLLESVKEKSENVMIVDLVRNDLSRICEEGSVYVEELFGVYSFPHVHQMMSTIKGKIKPGLHFTEALKATFPMGSMTGAPKKRVMQLIDTYEPAARGLFSGAIGYVTPNADFDFNVVIRSIFYNETSRYLSFSAGGGITFYSKAEEEYKECMLKAEAIRQVLENAGVSGLS